MKHKKLFWPAVIVLSGMLITVVLNIFLCIAKVPAITEHRFPFSVTYELGGETFTIEDEYVASYTGTNYANGPSNRHYTGYHANGDEIPSGDYLIQSFEDGELVLITRLFPGYLMGDPNYAEDRLDEPYIAYYVYEDYLEYTEEEYLAPYGVRIVDWDYPEPLENTFVFSEIARLSRHNVLPMAAVALLTLLFCVFFVKKDLTQPYSAIDKLSIVLNFAISIVVLPFLTLISSLVDLNGSAEDPLSIATFFVPALLCYGLAASVCLRRKGYKKSAFWIQFIGIAYFALILLIEAVYGALR